MIAGALMLAPPTLAVAAAEADKPLMAVMPVCAPGGTLTSVKVAGRTVENPLSPVGAARLKELVPTTSARLTITSDIDTPYRCIGALIYGLQALGYSKIGFISEPPAVRHSRR